jgi:hypothetical protein
MASSLDGPARRVIRNRRTAASCLDATRPVEIERCLAESEAVQMASDHTLQGVHLFVRRTIDANSQRFVCGIEGDVAIGGKGACPAFCWKDDRAVIRGEFDLQTM